MCIRKPTPINVVCGGQVDRSYLAPKTIRSRELVAFSVHYYLEYYAAGDIRYEAPVSFSVENGLFSTSYGGGISAPVDEDFLTRIRDIIDRYGLVALNGRDKHTAGLPPQFQPCWLSATYASGEKLYFSTNNDPTSDWGRALFFLYREKLVECGRTELKPTDESRAIDRFEIRFALDGQNHLYTPITSEDGTVRLMRHIYPLEQTKDFPQPEKTDLPENLYDKLSVLIFKLDMAPMDTGRLAFGNECDRHRDFYEIYIDFKDGGQIYDWTNDPDRIGEYGHIFRELADFFDFYF